MKTIKNIDLTLSINTPVECTKDEAQEWIDFQITGGSIGINNPLVDYELKDMISFSGDSGLIEYKTDID